jgi:molybdopterin synthase sulfur carrier subunit
MEVVTVKVLFFAVSKEISGKSEADLIVKSKIPYSELKQLICENFGLEIIKQNIILAVNQDYCEEGDLVLKENDELAVIPPLSAG